MKNRRKKDPEFKKRTNRHIMKYNTKKAYENKLKIINFLGGLVCSCDNENCWHKGKCKVNDIRVFDFEHINKDGKQDREKFSNSRLFFSYYANHEKEAKKRLRNMCSNCHRIRHNNDRI